MSEDCLCGDINARHCPVHNDDTEKPPREWWISEVQNEVCRSRRTLKALFPESTPIHVVEHSALTQAITERDNWKDDYRTLLKISNGYENERDELLANEHKMNGALSAKQEQIESLKSKLIFASDFLLRNTGTALDGWLEDAEEKKREEARMEVER